MVYCYFEVFTGLPIDGPENGPAPLPWDIVISPPEMFQDNKFYKEVPHTASVKVVPVFRYDAKHLIVIRLATVVWVLVLRGVESAMEREMYGTCFVYTYWHLLPLNLDSVW